MRAQTTSVFGQQFLDAGGVSEVVSAPMAAVGNAVRMELNVYSVSGADNLLATLEGSVLGGRWENIAPDTGNTDPSLGAIGAIGANYTVKHSMLRCRVKTSGASLKAWFDVGLGSTDQ